MFLPTSKLLALTSVFPDLNSNAVILPHTWVKLRFLSPSTGPFLGFLLSSSSAGQLQHGMGYTPTQSRHSSISLSDSLKSTCSFPFISSIRTPSDPTSKVLRAGQHQSLNPLPAVTTGGSPLQCPITLLYITLLLWFFDFFETVSLQSLGCSETSL